MNIKQVSVQTKAELASELNKKTDEIIVRGDFSPIIAEIKKGQLNDTERYGFAVGSGGIGVLLEYCLNKLMDVFDPMSKDDKSVRRQIEQLYTIKRVDAESFLLRLKQLDY
ncbi:hypothetical protein [Enterococcus sp. 5H]|uniref:hypothetical protein n=1 Tax=Enterococcus sp. 5H TaxID=1229490 RepID=UPI002304A7A3|nr:hypothetical protein [Enterococcus sp. 5H]MDA9471154.1 hypothetical protein [Enterococcus sp. 5H]